MKRIANYIKKHLKRLSPQKYERFRERYNTDGRLYHKIIKRQGSIVADGPFKGMCYIDASHGSRLVPKLTGSYELELHEIINETIQNPPSVIIDVGCAEGYYAVGFARALPQAKVFAYDIDSESRELCSRLAKLNEVSGNLSIGGECNWDVLNRLPLDDALVLCDCEGFELELLNPEKVPELKKARMLVEFHDVFVPGVTDSLLERFSQTHTIKRIDIKGRNPEEYPALSGLSDKMLQLALYERDIDTNPPQQWGYFMPDLSLSPAS